VEVGGLPAGHPEVAQPEVRELDVRPDVTVDDAVLVEVLQGADHLRTVEFRNALWKRAEVLLKGIEIAAGDELGNEVDVAPTIESQNLTMWGSGNGGEYRARRADVELGSSD
jgi:hypothetical protein